MTSAAEIRNNASRSTGEIPKSSVLLIMRR
jgi:hypothetical protein